MNRLRLDRQASIPASPGRLSRRPDLSDQSGSTLIEVVVSALMLVILAIAVLGAFDSANRATAEERHRAQAHGLAEDDLARMRSMRTSDLSNLNESREIVQDGSEYSVASRAEFVTDSTGTATCEAGVASADYILTTSTVSWSSMGNRPPVVAKSIVAPPNGSVSPNSGSLAVRVEDGANEGIPGVGLSGTGTASFSGSTGENGCVIFGNLPAGNYTLTASGSSLVDRDGNSPQAQSTSVVADSTNTIVLQYDQPGSIPITFKTRVGGSLVDSSADSIVAFNTGMTSAKVFGTVGSPASQITAGGLFPFGSPYSVYAGSCEGDNPNPTGEENPPGEPAIATVVVPAGLGADATIQLPALHLKVWSGSGPSSPGSPVSDARVRIADRHCTDEDDNPIMRTFTTDLAGGLPDPGLPYSDYDVCADDGATHVSAADVSVKDLDDGTTLDLYLADPAAQSGACP